MGESRESMTSIEVQPENVTDEKGAIPIAGENISSKADEPPPPAYNDVSKSSPPVAASGVENAAFSQPTLAQPTVIGQPATTTATTVTVAQPMVAGVIVQQPMMLGHLPCQTTCPFCSSTTITRTQHVPGTFTWLVCGGIFLSVCCLGCCLIPFCCNDCKDTDHYCQNCGRLIAKQQRM